MPGASRQVLETACSIKYTFTVGGETFNTAMGFYDCCDIANQIGLLSDDGKLVEDVPGEISIKNIQGAFLRKTATEIFEIMEMVDNVRETASAQ